MCENAQKGISGISCKPCISGTYTNSSGYWLFGFASKKYHPLDDFRPEEWKKLGIKTRYYTTNLHRGAFMLPGYVEQMLEEEENEKKA
jgi:spermidine synthase